MSELQSNEPNDSAKLRITAVVCTYNPRKDYFHRTLESLRCQTLPRDQWKLIVADNNSNPPVALECLENVGEPSRLLVEPTPGKVNAMAGVTGEIESDWVVFVDDDNVLDANYFEKLLDLDASHPRLGVMSANITGEFECEVPSWANPYLWLLAIRPLESAIWANTLIPHVGPIGAAMCVRKPVYDEFVRRCREGSVSAAQGRSGGSLAAGTDDTVFMDIAFGMGYGCGAFPELKMTHLISKERLELQYLVRLAKDMTASHTVLAAARQPLQKKSLKDRLRPIYRRLRLFGMKAEPRAMELAFLKGRDEGARQVVK